MSTLKKLASETAIYGLSSIIGRSLNYLLVPFYTHVFLPEEYGVVTELYSYAAFLNVVFTFGMETAFFRFSNKEGADKEMVFQSMQSLLILSTFLIGGLGILFSESIATVLKYPGEGSLIVSLLLIVGIDTLLALSFAKLRLEGKARKFAFVKLLNIVLNIGLNIWFFVIMPLISPTYTHDVSLVLTANLIANLAQMLFFTTDVRNWHKLAISWGNTKQYLVYAMPLMVMGLAGMVNEVLDRIVLKFLLTDGFYETTKLAAVGIYGACYKLSAFVTIGIQAFRYASEPFFFSKAQDKNSPLLYAKVMHWFVFACTGVLVFVSLNLDWIQYVLRNPDYREGLVIVPILLAANLFLGIYYNLSIWYKLTDKTRYGMYISIGGAFVTIGLNLLLVPMLGYLGSAWATFGCYFLMALVSYLLGHSHYRVPYNILFIGICSAVGITVSILFWDANVTNQFLDSLLKNIVAAIVLAILYLLGRKVKTL